MNIWKNRIAYGASDLASNLVLTMISSYMLIFYTDVFGLTAAAAGTVLLLARVADVLASVVLGAAIDRTHSRWGQHRPYFLFGCLPFGIIAVAAFFAPDLSAVGKMVYALLTCSLLNAAYCVVNLPVTTILPTLTDDPHERSVLVTFRMIFAALGVTLVSTFTNPLIERYGGADTRAGYRFVILLYAAAAVALFLFTFFNLRETVPLAPKRQRSNLLQDLRAMDLPCWLSIVMGFLYFTAYSFRSAAILYYFTYNLQREDLIPLIGLVGTLSGIVPLLLLPFIIERFGKRMSLAAGVLLYLASGLLFVFAGSGVFLYLALFLNGAGFYLTQGVTFTISPDVIDHCEYRTGRSIAGIHSALSSCIGKLGMGLSGFVVGLLLRTGGYAENAVQTPLALRSIRIAFIWIPTVLCVLLLLSLPFYRLEKEMPRVRAALGQRRSAAVK